MNPATIQLASKTRELAEAQKRIAHLTQQLERSTRQIEDLHKVRRPKIRAEKPRPRLKGDVTRLILCDLHGSKMSTGAAQSALGLAKQLVPNEVFLLGDMVDCGGFLAQHHTLGYVAETPYTYEQDIASAAAWMRQLRDTVPNAVIEYLEGNHEQRVERWCVTESLRSKVDSGLLMRRLAPQNLIDLPALQIRHYRMGRCYDGLTVQGTLKRGNCYFTHGSFLTSKHAAHDAVARFAGNVWYGNTHRADVYIGHRANVGVVGAWNPGCLCELQPLWQNTNPTDWTHGVGVQFVSRTGKFLNLIVPIIDGECLLNALLSNEHPPANQDGQAAKG